MAVKTITTSLRFNDNDSTYLNRTPGSQGNRNTWTFSCWLKRGDLVDGYIFNTATTLGTNTGLTNFFFSGNALRFYIYNVSTTHSDLSTTALFRDPAAWYHVVLRYDDTQATAADRVRIYVNGVLQTLTGSYPSQNFTGYLNMTIPHVIGQYTGNGQGIFYDGYMTEVHFLDGQSLDASAFGELDANNEWQPKVTSFTSAQYGLNGFYLSFADGSNFQTLGLDTAPTGTGHTAANNWTTNNFNTFKTSQIEIITNGIHLPTANLVNQNTNNFVAWHWKKGVTPGFDIVQFTRTANGTTTFNHGLGVTPAMVVIKFLSGASGFVVGHRSLGVTSGYLSMNATTAFTSSANAITTNTSTQCAIGTDYNGLNGDYIAYLWAEVPGFSRFGSYTGNGSTDGPFVWTGFRPAFLMIKRSDVADNWIMFDNKNAGYNPDNDYVYANLTNSNGTGDLVDFLSNGFKLRSTSTTVNASGTYVFAAFAEKSFKYARAR